MNKCKLQRGLEDLLGEKGEGYKHSRANRVWGNERANGGSPRLMDRREVAGKNVTGVRVKNEGGGRGPGMGKGRAMAKGKVQHREREHKGRGNSMSGG